MPSEVSTVGGDPSVEELRRELAEAREQQAATAGILAAISNSPTGAHRVFAEIAASAARLCDAYDAVILQVDGNVLRVVGHYGSIPTPGDISIANGTVMGGTVLSGERFTSPICRLKLLNTLWAATLHYVSGSARSWSPPNPHRRGDRAERKALSFGNSMVTFFAWLQSMSLRQSLQSLPCSIRLHSIARQQQVGACWKGTLFIFQMHWKIQSTSGAGTRRRGLRGITERC